MRHELYGKAYERPQLLDRAREKTVINRRMPIYWRMLSLSAVSVVCTLLVLSLFDHFAPWLGVNKRARGSSPLEIARLEDSRNPAGIDKSHAFIDKQPPLTSSPKTPVGLTVVSIYPPLQAASKRSVGVTKQSEARAPDLAVVSAPDRGVLDVYRIDLPSAPPIDPAHSLADFHPPSLGSETAVGVTKQSEAPAPDLAVVSAPDRDALDKYRTDLPSASLIHPAGHSVAPAASSGAMSADVRSVIAALEKYSGAWNAKHVAEITSLRPALRARAVAQELSSVRSITMRIRPTSDPRIIGNRATVECIHQVDQVFSDGVEKHNPGVKMTYVLVRHGSDWLIADSR